jgi:hypothetical protein
MQLAKQPAEVSANLRFVFDHEGAQSGLPCKRRSIKPRDRDTASLARLWRIGELDTSRYGSKPCKGKTRRSTHHRSRIRKNRLTPVQAMFGQCWTRAGQYREPLRTIATGNLEAMLAGDVRRRNQR